MKDNIKCTYMKDSKHVLRLVYEGQYKIYWEWYEGQ